VPERYWLMKVEPSAYSIDDLARDGKTLWTGVRNYQSRNTMRDEMKAGDGVLFYASSADPTGVSGVAEVSRAGLADPTAFDRSSEYFDPKSDPAKPTWFSAEISFVEKFAAVVPLATLQATKGLEDMMVTKKGQRLSVQPVKPAEFKIVLKLGRRK